MEFFPRIESLKRSENGVFDKEEKLVFLTEFSCLANFRLFPNSLATLTSLMRHSRVVVW